MIIPDVPAAPHFFAIAVNNNIIKKQDHPWSVKFFYQANDLVR